MNEPNPNEYNQTRRDQFLGGKTVEYIHKLSADLFNQNLYMISNVEMDIEITPHTNSKIILNWRDFATPPTKKQVETDEEKALREDMELRRDQFADYMLEVADIRLMVKTLDLMDGLIWIFLAIWTQVLRVTAFGAQS